MLSLLDDKLADDFISACKHNFVWELYCQLLLSLSLIPPSPLAYSPTLSHPSFLQRPRPHGTSSAGSFSLKAPSLSSFSTPQNGATSSVRQLRHCFGPFLGSVPPCTLLNLLPMFIGRGFARCLLFDRHARFLYRHDSSMHVPPQAPTRSGVPRAGSTPSWMPPWPTGCGNFDIICGPFLT